MREILFRGKEIFKGTIRKNYWKYGNLIQGNHSYIRPFEGGTVYEVYPETASQYTGLTDKNGTKIFEGDIVRITTFNDGFTEKCETGVIRFGFGSYDLQIGIMSGKPFISDVLDMIRISDVEYEAEIIGNIYDNPELLKEEK